MDTAHSLSQTEHSTTRCTTEQRACSAHRSAHPIRQPPAQSRPDHDAPPPRRRPECSTSYTSRSLPASLISFGPRRAATRRSGSINGLNRNPQRLRQLTARHNETVAAFIQDVHPRPRLRRALAQGRVRPARTVDAPLRLQRRGAPDAVACVPRVALRAREHHKGLCIVHTGLDQLSRGYRFERTRSPLHASAEREASPQPQVSRANAEGRDLPCCSDDPGFPFRDRALSVARKRPRIAASAAPT